MRTEVSGEPARQHALSVSADELIADPYPHLARLRREGPVHCVDHNGRRVWWIVGYDEARQAFSDPRFSVDYAALMEVYRQDGRDDPIPSEAGIGPFNRDLLSTDPPDHTRLRDTVRRRFAPRQIEAVRPKVQEVVDELIDAMAPRGVADLVRDFANELSLRVICHLLGVPVHEARPVAEIPPRRLTQQEEAELLYQERRYVLRIVERARPGVDLRVPEHDQPDVLSALIAAADGHGKLSWEELLDMVEILFTAATRGPGAMIAHAMAVLLTQRDQLELLQRRPDLVVSAVEELLRYEGTEEIARMRVTIEDVEIGGTTIPKGSRVQIYDSAANRDPHKFSDPGRLDITRRENRHLAFGHGIHFCLGATLSRIEAQVAIGTLVRRLPDIELACDPHELTWVKSPHVLGRLLHHVPVRFTPRSTES